MPQLPFPAAGANDATAARYKRVALSSRGGAPLAEVDLAGNVVLLLGAEREGLPAGVERDLEAWIPIGSESLNVAAAVAICLFEQIRQRSRA